MLDIVGNIFENKQYKSFELKKDIKFYYYHHEEVANYYYVYNLSLTEELKNEDINLNEESTIREKMRFLEDSYIGNIEDFKDGKNLLTCTKEVFNEDIPNKTSNLMMLKKNLSAIYLVKINYASEIEDIKNYIYELEESPKYFKRYVLPYTNKQVSELKELIGDNNDDINELLIEIIEEEECYTKLSQNRYLDEYYSLVLRLFSKVPILEYNKKEGIELDSLDQVLKKRIDEDINKVKGLKIVDEFIRETVEEKIEVDDLTGKIILDKILEKFKKCNDGLGLITSEHVENYKNEKLGLGEIYDR